MSDHRAPRPSHLWAMITSVPLRAALCLGMLLGFGAIGTVAYWSDSATVAGGSFSAGSLDLQVGATTADQLAGQGGTWNYTALTLFDMIPGESVARSLTIKNTGTTALTYNGVISTTSATLGTNLQATIVKDGAVSNSGSQAAGNRAGVCGTGTTWQTNLPLSTTTQPVTTATVTLQPGATTTLCVKIGLGSATPGTFQTKSTSVTMLFTANQP